VVQAKNIWPKLEDGGAKTVDRTKKEEIREKSTVTREICLRKNYGRKGRMRKRFPRKGNKKRNMGGKKGETAAAHSNVKPLVK